MKTIVKTNILKYCFLLTSLVVFFSCDSTDAFDCLQTAGETITQEIEVPVFNRLVVNRDIECIIKQSDIYKVTLETGNNLLNDINIKVENNQLILTDNNNCNLVRDFGITKVYIETPNLTEIRCSTQYDIRSEGVLNFDELALISENFNFPDSLPIGDFKLQLNVNSLRIISNNISFFYLSGNANQLNISFAEGNGRFEGRNLIAQRINVFHRGSNDMIVNPQQSLNGKILSTGNVISVNQPAELNVEELYIGRLIFE